MAAKKPAGATGEGEKAGAVVAQQTADAIGAVAGAAGDVVAELRAAVDALAGALAALTVKHEGVLSKLDHDLRNVQQAVSFGSGAADKGVADRLARLERHAGL